MKTIRTKLLLIFTVVMIFLVLCGIFLNSIFLESYYIYKNKKIFLSANKKITSKYINDKENMDEYIDMIDNIDNIRTIIVNENFNIEYNSFPKKEPNRRDRGLSKEIKETILENEDKLLNEYVYYIEQRHDDSMNKLIFISSMNNGKFIILSKSLKGIYESASIANQFYMLAALIVIIIGGIFIFIFSKKITKPIIEMSNVAENISNLKFDKRVHINLNDEMGSLGKSINKISEKLSTSINDLKEDVEKRKQLVRDMSHELKTPIGIIKGYAEGIKYGVAYDKEKIERYCSVLVEECDRMDRLIQELLNHSMMESGTVKINRTSFQIKEFVTKIIERFSQIFIDKCIDFKLVCENNYVISADSNMLEKAINNFITNAIDHVDGRRVIELTIENKEDGIEISVFNTGSYIQIENLEKIWDVYYKTDKARSRTYGGHGLGLSIVKLIADLHGGSTKVKNIEDGVIFSLKIPNCIIKLDK
ncbi:HAMP domain-containing sensor histidine kinase [Clostridium taeniosporum]|uniref:histidine kinase n=1 Tax=Clostridium taeniosporum TaxID=394958 RepID=A0A1D7XKC0_9CLOT|nr:HAMP domain-containing sensor histidine kinase [Clostridium taeniosporum]AOR23793.1 sensor histidine kinase [Clostridium taeniosporum]